MICWFFLLSDISLFTDYEPGFQKLFLSLDRLRFTRDLLNIELLIRNTP